MEEGSKFKTEEGGLGRGTKLFQSKEEFEGSLNHSSGEGVYSEGI
jgi:hypothetical protein